MLTQVQYLMGFVVSQDTVKEKLEVFDLEFTLKCLKVRVCVCVCALFDLLM
jgi:hypothetical protein